MHRTFYLLLIVQFISTIADNAFLIIAIARVIELASADWVTPMLKIGFTVFYVFLAPFVGPLADAIPKGRVMLLANAVKVGSVLLLLYGVDPILALLFGGLGAAIYAPAKYGLITELLPAKDLVRANGFFESATVCAVIFGTVLGGVLISPFMPHIDLPTQHSHFGGTPTELVAGMLCLLALNVLALALSFGVGDSGKRYPHHSFHPVRIVRRFFQENAVLWRDPLGGISMSVTTLLWGVGATLQLIVLRWANEVLGLTLAQGAYLQGVTAVGAIAGAALASRFVALHQAIHVLPLGIVMGLLFPAMLAVQSIEMAVLLLVLLGTLAGFFIVPMNALLQYRGCTLLTAGRSIAVQGFNENAGMLVMLAVYAVATALQLSLHSLIWSFGLLVAGCMAVVVASRNKVLLGPSARPH
ncbi:MAG: lysophospholipid transporter LplT [Pseudomonadota bacterium]